MGKLARKGKIICDWEILSQGALQPRIAGNFGAGGNFDFVPPGFPAIPTKQAPLKIHPQKAQLIRPGLSRMSIKTGMKAGEISHPSLSRQPAMEPHSD